VLLGVVEAVLLADGIALLVSIAAGAGAIAGAEVSAVAASSFLDVQAASARTAATRARRFIYDLLGRANVELFAGPCTRSQCPLWRGRKFISSGIGVKGKGA